MFRDAIAGDKQMANNLSTITGLEDVQRMLREAPKNIVAFGFIKAVSAGGNVIADELEVRTPVKKEDTGGLLDKGELRESLMVAYSMDSQLRWAAAQIGFGKNGRIAAWIDGGHALVGHKPGKKPLGNVAGTGFMRAAADHAADPSIDAVTKSIAETVRTHFPQGRTL
jgi:hypothetical protein